MQTFQRFLNFSPQFRDSGIKIRFEPIQRVDAIDIAFGLTFGVDSAFDIALEMRNRHVSKNVVAALEKTRPSASDATYTI